MWCQALKELRSKIAGVNPPRERLNDEERYDFERLLAQ